MRDWWNESDWLEKLLAIGLCAVLLGVVLVVAFSRECPEGKRCTARTPQTSGTVIMSDGKVGFISSGGECLKCE